MREALCRMAGRAGVAVVLLAAAAALAGAPGRAAGAAALECVRRSPRALEIDWRAPAGGLTGRPEPVLVLAPRGAELAVAASAELWQPCPAPAAGPDFDPTGPAARILADGVARHLRLVSLAVNPFRRTAAGGWERAGRMRIWFQHSQPLVEDRPPARLDRLEESLARLAANGAEAGRLRSLPPAPARPAAGRDAPAFKIGTSQSAVTWVAGQLESITTDPRHLQLTAGGETVPIWVIGEEDGSFDAGDAVLFFGAPYHPEEFEDDRYTDTQVYWLTDAGVPAARFTPLGAPPGAGPVIDHGPARVHAEENREPAFHSDKFYWTLVRAGESLDFAVVTPDVVADGGPAVLRYSLWGYTSLMAVTPDHHVQLLMNGRPVLDAYLDDYEQLSGEIELLAGELVAGANTVRVVCPGDTGAGEIDAVSVDWFEVDYERRHVADGGQLVCRSPAVAEAGPVTLRVEGLAGPDVEVFDLTVGRRLTDTVVAGGGEDYQVTFGLDLAPGETHELAVFRLGSLRQPEFVEPDVPSDWADPAHGADLIVIVHALFRESIEPYVQQARASGLRVAVVDVEDVFDEFSAGVFQPPAIQTFVRHAYRYWQPPAPEALLLVGDANWDYKGYLGPGIVPNYVPGYAKDNPYSGGDRPGGDRDPFRYGDALVDDQFVCVDGMDALPDLLIARLPVGSPDQAELVVAKILAQLTGLPAGPWRRRMVFITGGVDDAEQDLFGNQSTALIDRLVQPAEKGFAVARVDKETEGYGWGEYEDEIKAEIDAGAALVNFFGHAGSWSWEAMFDFADIDQLANDGRLPLVTSMTCNTLRFGNPDMQSFGERFLLTASPATGAAGVWGGCTFGDIWADYYLAYHFLDHALEGGEGGVGAAIMLSKVQTMLQHPEYSFILEPYSYLGDPYARFAWGAAGEPRIWLAGTGAGRLDASAGGTFQLLAYVSDPDGPFDVRRVELTVAGVPTGVCLGNAGLTGDFGVHDGLFGLTLEVGAGLVPAGRYGLGLTATDMAGHQSCLWPELMVGP